MPHNILVNTWKSLDLAGIQPVFIVCNKMSNGDGITDSIDKIDNNVISEGHVINDKKKLLMKCPVVCSMWVRNL